MAKLSEINLLSVGHTIGLSGAIFSGEGKLYLVPFPESRGVLEARQYNAAGDQHVVFETSRENLEVEVLDMDADDWKAFLDQADQLNTEVLARAADGTLSKVVLRKSQRVIEMGVQWRVFKRDSYKCRYCANDNTPLTVDHLVLWEEGGPSTVENLVAACRKCNKSRGNKPYGVWLKDAYYLKVSKALTADEQSANQDLEKTLDAIPRRVYQPSR